MLQGKVSKSCRCFIVAPALLLRLSSDSSRGIAFGGCLKALAGDTDEHMPDAEGLEC